MHTLLSKRNLNIQLLLFTSFLIFIVPLFPIVWHQLLYDLSFTLVFINAVLVVEYYKKFNIWLASVSILMSALSIMFELPVIYGLSTTIRILFYFYLSAMFIGQIARSKVVNVKVILECIIGYLMIGIAFGLMITLVMLFDPSAFSLPDNALISQGNLSGVSTYIYASIVTLSTLGYGDILPSTTLARSLATFITICGQFYMAIIVALLIGKFSANANTN